MILSMGYFTIRALTPNFKVKSWRFYPSLWSAKGLNWMILEDPFPQDILIWSLTPNFKILEVLPQFVLGQCWEMLLESRRLLPHGIFSRMEIMTKCRDLTLLSLLLQPSPAELPRPFPTGRWWARISAGAPVSPMPASKATSCPCLPCSPARATAPGAGTSPSASVSWQFPAFPPGFCLKSRVLGLFPAFFFPGSVLAAQGSEGARCASCPNPKGSFPSAGVGIFHAMVMFEVSAAKVWLLWHLPHALVFWELWFGTFEEETGTLLVAPPL